MVVDPDALRRQAEAVGKGYYGEITAITIDAMQDPVSFGVVVRGFVLPCELIDLGESQGCFTPSLSKLKHVYNSALYGAYCFGTG